MPVVHIAGNIIEAHLCRQMLEAEGIEARIDGAILSQARGELPLGEATNPSVLVSDADFERAREFVLQMEDKLTARDEEIDWTCSHCQEQNPDSFESCWNCSTEREPAVES